MTNQTCTPAPLAESSSNQNESFGMLFCIQFLVHIFIFICFSEESFLEGISVLPDDSPIRCMYFS